jgi:tyrosyl-tRNA synthetase
VPLLALRRFQLAGHRPILLVGGATGLIGDPSGRSSERKLNDAGTVSSWVDRIRYQVAPFLDFEGPAAAVIVNNLEWTGEVRLIDFLRDIGKHFSVNAMIQRDSVRSRLERDGDGISFTEFSYMLLQAMDYLHLAQTYDCSLQIGGSDQWGNIVSGMDLVRRKLQRESYALTLPLVTKSDGTKFGKSAAGAVWLDANKTSAYALYQFFVNTADADVERFLGYFTFMDRAFISSIMHAHQKTPEQRVAQRALAREITQLVHGDAAVESAERITQALFSGDPAGLGAADLRQLAQDGVPVVNTAELELGLLEALVRASLAQSNSAARKLVLSGAIRINGDICIEPTRLLRMNEGLHGRYFLIRRGKREWAMVDQTG